MGYLLGGVARGDAIGMGGEASGREDRVPMGTLSSRCWGMVNAVAGGVREPPGAVAASRTGVRNPAPGVRVRRRRAPVASVLNPIEEDA